MTGVLKVHLDRKRSNACNCSMLTVTAHSQERRIGNGQVIRNRRPRANQVANAAGANRRLPDLLLRLVERRFRQREGESYWPR